MKRLCFANNGMLYFTEKKLENQWGDGWDDYPYQLSAGLPYEDDNNQIQCIYVKPGPRCSIFLYPSGEKNKMYSVKDVNGGITPWVMFDFYGIPREIIKLYAGTSLDECIDLLLKYECRVFIETR